MAARVTSVRKSGPTGADTSLSSRHFHPDTSRSRSHRSSRSRPGPRTGSPSWRSTASCALPSPQRRFADQNSTSPGSVRLRLPGLRNKRVPGSPPISDHTLDPSLLGAAVVNSREKCAGTRARTPSRPASSQRVEVGCGSCSCRHTLAHDSSSGKSTNCGNRSGREGKRLISS